MKALLLISLILTTATYAHTEHDWREDYEAFLRVHYRFPIMEGKSLKRRSAPSRIEMNFFKEKLKLLSEATPDRKKDEHRYKARSILAKEYHELGFEVSFHGFGQGTNFIAEKKGVSNPEKVLILSSHFDTVKTIGANDNGTGTIGALTLAKELSKNNYAHTVRILGFDKEEDGLKGSDAYVSIILEKQNIIGNINFEMMGVNSRKDGAFHVIDCKRKDSLFLSEGIQKSINRLGLNLNIVETCTRRSDHASFWRAGIPAIVISENFFGGDSDPCYHARCDIVDDRLDYDYMGRILEATLDATEEIIKKI